MNSEKSIGVWNDGVSVIVHTNNDASKLKGFFQSLSKSEVLEVLVCDEKSTDDTVAIARNNGAGIFRSSGCMSETFNLAARNSRGSILWFLSPSCRPDAEAALYIMGEIEHADAVAGYYATQSCKSGGIKGWYKSKILNFKASWLGRIHPRCGFFIRHSTFDLIGGCQPKKEKHAIDYLHSKSVKYAKPFVMPLPLPVLF